ncbi:MAG: phospholipase D-like domain-containing protein [Candidatus Aureabacteria bacterium]|nr:phospholipase D-like domain-containing protein [Candidatus Auribacterota bacterium]
MKIKTLVGTLALCAACVSLCGAAVPVQEIIAVVNDQYLPAALEGIASARSTIEFIQLEFHYVDRDSAVKKIAEAMGAAVKRGVKVRGIIDDGIDFNPPAVPLLKKMGIDVKLDTPAKMTHDKLFIFDGREVLLGSTNLSWNSMERNNETNVLIRDEVIGKFFRDYFAALWSDSAKEPEKAPFNSGVVRVITNRAYFKEVMDLFASAKGTIKVFIYGISYSSKDGEAKANQLVDALIAARKRGIKVEVLLDKSNYNQAINKVNAGTKKRLGEGGVEVRYDAEKVTSHAKLLCVDDAVLVGSYNWGRDALEERNECAVIMRDKKTTEFFNKYFDTIWEGKEWPKRLKPAPAVKEAAAKASPVAPGK